MKIAYYSLGYRTMDITIPKRGLYGYLKSCFGHHHSNKQCSLFDNIKPKTVGDTCDIDGYLSIELKIHSWESGYKEMITQIIGALKECFPHVTEFKEDSDKFWSIVNPLQK